MGESMARTGWTIMLLGLLATPGPAMAQARDYCPARPGLGTPACTIAPGRVSVETGIVDWQRDEQGSDRSDMFTLGDTLVRIGLNDVIEAQLGWTPYSHVRVRDRVSGATDRDGAVGDALIGFKVNLRNPDGGGLSFAVQPFVTLPVGGDPLSAGDWGAGLVAPVSYDLSDTLNLQFSPEIDAAVDGDGSGRHLAYSGTIGLGVGLSDSVGGTVEVQAARDEDPDGQSTQWLAALSFSWMPSAVLQLDIGGAAGLNADAPDAELYVGISRQF
jgi:hypothetical protein